MRNMGKTKRKCSNSSSVESSFNFSNSSNSVGHSSQIASSRGNSYSSSITSLWRNFGDKKFKLSSTQTSSSNNGNNLSEPLAAPVKLSTTPEKPSNSDSELLGIFVGTNSYSASTKTSNQDCTRNKRNAEKTSLQKNTSTQDLLGDTFFDELDCTQSIKQHFSQLTQELIADADIVADINYGLQSNSESTAASDVFEFRTNLNEHFSKHFSDLQLSESGAENDDMDDIYNDSFLDQLVQINQISENSKNTKTAEVESKSNHATWCDLAIQQNEVVEHSGTECNIEDYLRDISFHSSDRIRKIQLEDFNVNQTTSSNDTPDGIGKIQAENVDYTTFSNVLDQATFCDDASEGVRKIQAEGFNLNRKTFSNDASKLIRKIQAKDLNLDQTTFSNDVSERVRKIQAEDFNLNRTTFSNDASKLIRKIQAKDLNLDQTTFSNDASERVRKIQAEDFNLNQTTFSNDASERIRQIQAEDFNLDQTMFSNNASERVIEIQDENFNIDQTTFSNDASERLRGIQSENLNLDQPTVSNDASIASYNFPLINLTDNLNNSLSSGALSTGSRSNLNDAAKRLRAGLNRISKDNSLIYTGSNQALDANLNNRKKDLIKTKIEVILEKFIETITQNIPLAFKVRNNQKWSNSIFQNDMLQLKPLQESIFTAIKYTNRGSKDKFNLITYLIIKNYVLLQTDSYSTQREIYYQLKNFLRTQDKISVAMNTISSMLNIEPWFFPIVPTSRGLVFGDLSIIISEEEIIRCNIFGGTLIPQDVTKIREFKSNAFFILVVEKDAIFKKLLDEDLPNRLTRPFIVVTGKGFPDINTRLFIKKLWMSLRIPIFILVDADPDGINIMLTYRFGSLNMAHVSNQLALPHIRWLGVFPSEIRKLNIAHQNLNDSEKNKIRAILKRPYVEEKPWLKRELQVLQENGLKAEIEGLIKSTAFLTDVYLPHKFYSRNYL